MNTIIAKSFVIPAVLCAALAITSCGGDSTTGPQTAESSSGVTAGFGQGSSCSSATTPGSSSGVIASSSGTQVRSSSSGGVVVSSSSGAADCTWQCVDACEGTVVWSTPTTQSVCRSGEWVELSSSSVAKSSSSRGNMDDAFNKALSYGEFTDPRDGQKYRTIVIGHYQHEYFAENLNYGKQITGGAQQTDSTKYCYGDDPWYCENHYGGLYRWSVAMGFPRACDTVVLGSGPSCPDTITLPVFDVYPKEAPFYVQVQGICPDGWHVMNEGEWSDILGGGASTVKSSAWQGSNTTGFTLLAGGIRFGDGSFDRIKTETYVWLPQEWATDATKARAVSFSANYYDNTNDGGDKSMSVSVRCVKDHAELF